MKQDRRQGAPEGSARALQPSATSHADALGADDEVIEYPHADQAQGLAQFPGDGSVGGAGLRHTTGMVVSEDGRAGIDAQGRAYHFPGIDAGTVDGAGEKALAVQDTVTVVQPQGMELLVRECAQTHAQEVGGLHRVADAALPLELPAQDGLGCFQDRLILGIGDGSAGRVAEGEIVGMTDSLE